MSRADQVIGGVLFAAALALGTWYVPQVVAAGGKPHFYQEQFGAAVMAACGHGYVNPNLATEPELRQFLALERDDFTCSDRLAGVQRLPLQPMQTAYRYLMTTVAWTWRLQGQAAWSRLAPLYGVFFASTVVLLFLLFRRGMGTVLSAALAVVLAISPLHVSYLAHLRDYSKAPFVLGLVLIAARLVVSPLSFRRALALAVGAGLLNGFGMGYRNDLLVAVPAFVAVLALFLPHDEFPRGWRNVALPAAFVAAFVIALSPMWSIYRTGGGNSSQHLVVLGLSESFNQELGLDSGGMYEWSYGYRDEYAHAIISGNATRRLGATGFLKIYGPDYDRAGSDYLSQVAQAFPADMLTRAYASAIRVIELPYNQKLMLPHEEYIRIPRPLLVLRDRFQRFLAPAWLWIVAGAWLALTVRSLRIGVFAFALVAYLSAYPAIQFGERHYFHLEFIGWWALGFAASLIGSALYAVRHEGLGSWFARRRPALGWPLALGQAAAAAAILGIAIVAPLAALRTYQQGLVKELVARYLAAPTESAPLTPIALGNGSVRFVAPLGPDAESDDQAVHPELVMAEFGGPTCDSLKLDAVFRYQTSESRYDFSRTMAIQPPLSDTPLRVFFPAYLHRPLTDEVQRAAMGLSDYRLAGLDLPERAQSCLLRLARVTDTQALPVLVEWRLPPRWEQADLFQTITGLESRTNGDEAPAVFTFPADLEVGRQLLMAPLESLAARDIAQRSPTLNTDTAQWLNQGVGGVGGKGSYLYLFEMQPREISEGRLALVQGYIKKGGISFGLVSEGAWIAQAGVTHPGEFTVVIRVPATGRHSLVLANNLIGASLESDVTIRRVGWVTSAP